LLGVLGLSLRIYIYGSHLDLKGIETTVNEIAAGNLRQGEKITITNTRTDTDTSGAQKLVGISFSVEGNKSQFGERTLPLGSVSVENGKIRASTFGIDNYFKDRGLKDY